ncbi:MAG: hypothetical protein WBV72_05245, partial [Nitrososphaeraceae archaeon]
MSTIIPQELDEICNNGQDDDNDGQVDVADSDCADQPSPTPGQESTPTPTVRGLFGSTIISPSPSPTPFPSPSPSPSPSPLPSPTPSLTPSPTPATIIKNVNNNQVTVTNDRFTVQDRTGAVTSTPDCSTQGNTIS